MSESTNVDDAIEGLRMLQSGVGCAYRDTCECVLRTVLVGARTFWTTLSIVMVEDLLVRAILMFCFTFGK
ncbi:hypothetical protein Syun_008763 [Stephania yunnanensis]|uniref:Uncharacterized protein n=1 Tax=Stephania yunnanensis TaxID=152371 RepID=A0AAP0KF68_9MAGN